MDDGDGGASIGRIESVIDDGIATIRLIGEIDSSNVEEIAAAVEPIVAEQPRRVVFELEQLTFVDSSGLAVLINAAKHAHGVELRATPALLRRVIAETGLERLFNVRP